MLSDQFKQRVEATLHKPAKNAPPRVVNAHDETIIELYSDPDLNLLETAHLIEKSGNLSEKNKTICMQNLFRHLDKLLNAKVSVDLVTISELLEAFNKLNMGKNHEDHNYKNYIIKIIFLINNCDLNGSKLSLTYPAQNSNYSTMIKIIETIHNLRLQMSDKMDNEICGHVVIRLLTVLASNLDEGFQLTFPDACSLLSRLSSLSLASEEKIANKTYGDLIDNIAKYISIALEPEVYNSEKYSEDKKIKHLDVMFVLIAIAHIDNFNSQNELFGLCVEWLKKQKSLAVDSSVGSLWGILVCINLKNLGDNPALNEVINNLLSTINNGVIKCQINQVRQLNDIRLFFPEIDINKVFDKHELGKAIDHMRHTEPLLCTSKFEETCLEKLASLLKTPKLAFYFDEKLMHAYDSKWKSCLIEVDGHGHYYLNTERLNFKTQWRNFLTEKFLSQYKLFIISPFKTTEAVANEMKAFNVKQQIVAKEKNFEAQAKSLFKKLHGNVALSINVINDTSAQEETGLLDSNPQLDQEKNKPTESSQSDKEGDDTKIIHPNSELRNRKSKSGPSRSRQLTKDERDNLALEKAAFKRQKEEAKSCCSNLWTLVKGSPSNPSADKQKQHKKRK